MTSEFGMKWSTDSLSSWSLSERTRTEYARRKLSETLGPSRRRPAELLDRRQLAKGFCQFGASRPRPSAATVEPIAGNSPPSLPAKDALLRCDFKLMDDKLQNKGIKKTEYQKFLLNKQYNILKDDLIELKKETLKILLRGVGDKEIVNLVQINLKNILTFFEQKLSYIMDSSWLQREKTLLLEHLRKLQLQNVHHMENWIDVVINVE